MQTIYDQIISFLITIGIGFLAGILFDIYRVIRNLGRFRKIGTYIGDIIFWCILTCVAFILLLFGNWGELRIYVFLGITIGFLFYLKKCSQQSQLFITKLFNIFIKTIKYFWRILTWPFRIIAKILLIPIGFITSGIVGMGKIMNKGYKKVSAKIKNKLTSLLNKQPPNTD